MPRVCLGCTHIDREELDAAIVSGAESNRSIANRFVLTPSAVHRHKPHVAATLSKAHEAHEVARADSLLDQVEALIGDARRLQRAAEAAGDLRTALAGVREVGRALELLARVTGELREQAAVTVNVLAVEHATVEERRRDMRIALDQIRAEAPELLALEPEPELLVLEFESTNRTVHEREHDAARSTP